MASILRPVPSDKGEITKILCVYLGHGQAPNRDQILMHFEWLFECLGSKVEYYIYTNALVGKSVRWVGIYNQIKILNTQLSQELKIRIAGNVNFKIIDNEINYCLLIRDDIAIPQESNRANPINICGLQELNVDWPQDMLNVLELADDQTPVLVKPLYYGSLSSRFMTDEICLQEPGFLSKPSDLYLPGGNVLPGRYGDSNYLLIGPDSITDNAGKGNMQQIEKELCEGWGADRVIWLGKSGQGQIPQALRHIDLYISLAGVKKEENTFIQYVFVADTAGFEFEKPTKETKRLKDNLDAISDWLKSFSEVNGFRFEPIRIPMLVYTSRSLIVGSYNNCIVNGVQSGLQIHVPDYRYLSGRLNIGLLNSRRFRKIHDSLVQQSWEKLTDILHTNNYRVISAKILPGTGPSPTTSGSLRCFTKVLQRR